MEGGKGVRGGGEVEKRGVEEEDVAVVVKTQNPPPPPPYKSKRDEWSEAAILTLLDAYESKWSLRNRAKLKGSDWEEIAVHVSSRTTPPAIKNPNQCKNKIESMKKKYRLESLSSSAAEASSNNPSSALSSSWPFYARMDQLLKGTKPLSLQSKVEDELHPFPTNIKVNSNDLPNLGPNLINETKKVSEDSPPVQEENCERNEGGIQKGEDHIEEGSNGDDNASENTVPVDRQEVSNQGEKGRMIDQEEENGGSDLGGRKVLKQHRKRSRGNSDEFGLGESIRLLASSVLKIEQGRMDMYRESERLRLEYEMKRAELELKRTEIMARTQLQVAKLFAKRAFNVDKISPQPASSNLVADPK